MAYAPTPYHTITYRTGTISRWCHEACLVDLLARLCRVCVTSDPRQPPSCRHSQRLRRRIALWRLVSMHGTNGTSEGQTKGRQVHARARCWAGSAAVALAVIREPATGRQTCAPAPRAGSAAGDPCMMDDRWCTVASSGSQKMLAWLSFSIVLEGQRSNWPSVVHVRED